MHGTMRTRATILSLALLAASALGDTIVVDDDSGADYDDLPPAVAAADEGDLLLVLPGTYSPFTLDIGLTVLGVGDPTTVRVDGAIHVDGQGVGARTVLSTLTCDRIEARQHVPLLLLEDLRLGEDTAFDHAGSTALYLQDCGDVRVFRTSISGGPEDPTVLVRASRCELVECSLVAGGGCSWEPGQHDPNCYEGRCLLAESSTVRFARSSAFGEDGQEFIWDLGGDGAHGLEVEDTDLIVSGLPGDVIRSGDGGEEWGQCGTPVILSGHTARISGVTLDPGSDWGGPDCDEVYGCCAEFPKADDPTLDLVGAAVPGNPLDVRLNAPPGSRAWLFLGGEAVVRPRVGIVEDQLTVPTRRVALGLVPPDGRIVRSLQVPAHMRTGDLLFAQVLVEVEPSDLRLTHSVPLLVH